MRYLCLIYHEAGRPAAEGAALADELGDYHELLRGRGQLVAAGALEPRQGAATVRARRGQLLVGEAPADPGDERLCAFYLIEARDLNEAIRVVAQLPQARAGPVVIRPVAEPGQV